MFRDAGPAPYLDYRPATNHERALVLSSPALSSLLSPLFSPDDEVMGYAITRIVPRHVEEVRGQRLSRVEKTEREVKARLTKEISYWDRRAQDLKDKERAGKRTRLPARVAQERADTLADRLQTRLAALRAERHIVAAPPGVTGGSLIIPAGLLRKLGAPGFSQASRADVADAAERKRVELLAMDAVMAAERALGRTPRDVSAERAPGYDIESKDPTTGRLLFLEVKGRQAGASSDRKSRAVCLPPSRGMRSLMRDRPRGALPLSPAGAEVE